MALTLGGHWKFEGDLVDSSGYGNDLTMTTGSTIEKTAIVENSLYWDGINNLATGSGASAEIASGTGDWAFCFWVWNDHVLNPDRVHIIKGDGDPGAFRCAINHGTNTTLVSIGILTNYGNYAVPFTETNYRWTHHVYNVSRTDDFIYGFRNGVASGSIAEGIDSGTTSGLIEGDDWYIGKPGSTETLTGRLDDLRIYTGGTLTLAQIKSIMRESYHYTNPTVIDSF